MRTFMLDVPDWPGTGPASTWTSGSPPKTDTGRTGLLDRIGPGEPLALTVERLDDGEVSPYLAGALLFGPDGVYATRSARGSCGSRCPARTCSGMPPWPSRRSGHQRIDLGGLTALRPPPGRLTSAGNAPVRSARPILRRPDASNANARQSRRNLAPRADSLGLRRMGQGPARRRDREEQIGIGRPAGSQQAPVPVSQQCHDRLPLCATWSQHRRTVSRPHHRRPARFPAQQTRPMVVRLDDAPRLPARSSAYERTCAERVDVIVIGAGPVGHTVAARSSRPDLTPSPG